ncbi:hypothetical protein CEXT_360201 [Caerostris extrusa]|uniref:Uncharacterized protein n=1 Tax=Caerostris extrusa TaxID=172846 RepID=A0AAV4VWT5_CAEEX|nr:hypothetical protein CEXT_360201 [Caerostris extrusa]
MMELRTLISAFTVFLRLHHGAQGQEAVSPLQPAGGPTPTAAVPHRGRVDMERPLGNHLRQHQRFKSC